MSAQIRGPVYVAGPMTGYPDDNKPAFFAAEVALVAAGHRVINPARVEERIGAGPHTWETYMREALVNIARAETVILLEGWQDSRGARLEHRIAQELNIPCIAYATY